MTKPPTPNYSLDGFTFWAPSDGAALSRAQRIVELDEAEQRHVLSYLGSQVEEPLYAITRGGKTITTEGL